MSHDEYAGEPIPGLPETLPPGELLIWQGTPQWRSLAVRAFHVRKIALYFAAIWLGFVVFDLFAGAYWQAITNGFWLLLPALLAIAVLGALAWLYARVTVYSITSKRVIIRSGIALPIAVNVPFSKIESAACRQHDDGTADVPIRVERGQNTSFVILWPNVRPWRFARPEPMLRCVPDGTRAADILAQALAEHAEPADDPIPGIQAYGNEPPAAAGRSRRQATA